MLPENLLGENALQNVTNEVIEEIVQIIVETVSPEQVILFGSRATEDAGNDSDIDLLIIDSKPFDKNRSRRQEMTKLWRLLSRFVVAKDILIYSREEVERWRNSLNHVVAKALREGKVLYERP